MSTINGIAASAYAQQQASQERQTLIQDARASNKMVEKSQSSKQDVSVLVEISSAARGLAQQKLADARQATAQQEAALEDAAVERKTERSSV